MNDKILKNVINICHDSPYPRWPVNIEPSNTFGTLELLFPISKKISFLFHPKRIFLFHSKNHRACFVKKRIVLVMFQKTSFLFHSKKHRSCFVPKRIVHSWHRCGLFSIGLFTPTTYYIANVSLIN